MDGKPVMLLLGISTILFVGTYADAPPAVVSTFSCSRDNAQCSGNGDCTISGAPAVIGKCVCTAPFGGYDCSILDVSDACTATITCDAAGTRTCYKIAGVNTCTCKPGFTGPNCDTQVSSLTCDGTKFYLTWLPTAVYPAGVPYTDVAIAPGTPCVTVNPLTPNIYEIEIARADCGITTTLPIGLAVVTTYKVDVVFQYHPSILVPSDDVVQLTCSFKGVENAVTDTDLTIVNYDTNGFDRQIPLSDSDTTALVGETYLSINGGAYAAVAEGTTGTIGNMFKLKVILQNPATTPFQKIRLLQCEASDGANGNIIPLLFNSCPVTSATGLSIWNRLDRVNDAEIDISIRVFKRTPPVPNATIRLKCNVKICIDALAADCNDLLCNPNFGIQANSGAGRKKRSVDVISNTTVGTISAWLPLGGPVGTQGQQQVVAEECSLSQEFIIIIVILCLLILLLAVATVYFALKRISKRRSKVDDMQTVYSNKT